MLRCVNVGIQHNKRASVMQPDSQTMSKCLVFPVITQRPNIDQFRVSSSEIERTMERPRAAWSTVQDYMYRVLVVQVVESIEGYIMYGEVEYFVAWRLGADTA